MSWVWDPPIQEVLRDADLVVVGKITEEKPSGIRAIHGIPELKAHYTTGVIQVNELLLGELPDGQVIIEYESDFNTSASINYELGQEGVWLLKQIPGGTNYEARLRSSFIPLEHRGDVEKQLKFLEK